MKTTLTVLALALTATAAVAQTPGYDRPGPEQAQPDGHAHLVYWSNFFDRFSNSAQTMADAYSVDALRYIGQKKPEAPKPASAPRPQK